jgi:hypothetical protein
MAAQYISQLTQAVVGRTAELCKVERTYIDERNTLEMRRALMTRKQNEMNNESVEMVVM